MTRHRITLAALTAGAVAAATLTVAGPIPSLLTPHRGTAAPETPTPPTAAAVARVLDDQPLAFEPNVGQADPQVAFQARVGKSSLFLTPTESVLALGGDGGAIRMHLEGGNPRPAIAGFDRLPTTVNYMVGAERDEWRTGVPTYGKVRSEAVYPGIDLVHRGTVAGPEYDFVVAPGADPAVIGLRFSGVDGLTLNDTGDLVLRHGDNELVQRRPVVYQDGPRGRTGVEGAFELRPDGKVGFRLGAYDGRLPLVIDPLLVSKFFGGGGDDIAHDIAVDGGGNVWVAGETSSPTFPLVNPIQGSIGNFGDAVVMKLSPTGTILFSTYLGGTRGSPRPEIAQGLALDASGNAYITGTTYSYNFPTTPGAYNAARSFPTLVSTAGSTTYTAPSAPFTAFDVGRLVTATNVPPGPSFAPTTIASVVNASTVTLTTAATTSASAAFTLAGHGDEVFVSKISSAGGLVWSTFLGGSGDVSPTTGDEGRDIAVLNGFPYVVGETLSADFPLVNPIRTTGGIFLTKLNQAGSGLVYSTKLGGSGGNGVAVDATGAAHVVGYSFTSDFPVVNAFQPTLTPGGHADAVVAKVNAAGNGIVWSTFLGGSDYEVFKEEAAIAVDAAANVYVTGTTGSTNFPTTAGSFQPYIAGAGGSTAADLFVAKFTSAGARTWATYLGGTGDESLWFGAKMAIGGASGGGGPAGAVYVSGQTSSTDFPTASPVQGRPSANLPDGFVTKLNPTGTGLVWSTYLGGDRDPSYGGREEAHGITLDGAGNVWVAGSSPADDFPSPPNQAAPTHHGNELPDLFVVKHSAGHAERRADFNADGRWNIAIYNPVDFKWYVHGQPVVQWGALSTDIPVNGDYDGNGTADVAYYRPQNNSWFVRNGLATWFGASGDVPVPADYDGDGDVDVAVFRPSTGQWFVQGGLTTSWGVNGDVPVPADYDGDGDADVAIYRPSTGQWYVQGGAVTSWGLSADVPVPGDYDGDGDEEPAVYRPSTSGWFASSGRSGSFGLSGDIPQPGDYDRDGVVDFAVYRPSTAQWFTDDGLSEYLGGSGVKPLSLPVAVRLHYYP